MQVAGWAVVELCHDVSTRGKLSPMLKRNTSKRIVGRFIEHEDAVEHKNALARTSGFDYEVMSHEWDDEE